MTNHCGTCTACCRVFDIPQLEKPAGEWCHNCAIGKGCKVYETRPTVCVEFECLWLQSQQRSDPGEALPLALRPDKCKVVFGPSTDPNVMAALTMPGTPTAWRRKDVRALIDLLVRNNNDYAVVCGAPRSTRRTHISRNGEKEVRMTEPDSDGIQWSIPDTP